MTTISSRPVASSPPPIAQSGPVAWLKKHLFNTWYNAILTVVLGLVLASSAWGIFNWIFSIAQWAVIPNNLALFMSGLYPNDQYGRIWAMLAVIVTMAGLSWGVLGRNLSPLFSRPLLVWLGILCALTIVFPLTRPNAPILIGLIVWTCALALAGQWLARQYKGMGKWLSAGWFATYFINLWLLGGGLFLETVKTSSWGGLTLTLLLAVSGIALCFPIGVVLALGRRSDLPVVKGLSIAYIELVRGVPLISILFMGQVMIPLFLPEGVRPDRIVRAIIGLTIFSSAYLAENVRAGLQAVPQGQFEAAASLGLNKPLTLALIVLPQALKTAIPAIVGQFISLFQDTTLLGVVGLVELLGISNSVLANPSYLGRYSEVYLFIALMYWFFCYAMSLGSRRVEKALHTGR
ncbi:MAG: amino acid ABC transporter permease [Cyanobacteria bacterium P01_A01_bin.105]